ncbi:MAG: hypothetical protein A2857_03215 [Candidatus Levybacteria bacterium RIFCSPHIGHO2_01_FULL_36_15]|nr:MAG: hypothetical protein A2857_03215 [Candidatus Levybacteria bacterium RIFCSPHIGHO2_01_FULL_36_15]OGH38258.1 MAG: hypothetical protein A2905_03445 [Candidatus Levybacteria bacterium RIFCSPLOWO2_01_FULL_36_10]
MSTIATITSKKQLTLPSEQFKKAGLREGEKVIISEENGRLIITSAQRIVEELAGSVSVPERFRVENIDEIIEQAKNKYFKTQKK